MNTIRHTINLIANMAKGGFYVIVGLIIPLKIALALSFLQWGMYIFISAYYLALIFGYSHLRKRLNR